MEFFHPAPVPSRGTGKRLEATRSSSKQDPVTQCGIPFFFTQRTREEKVDKIRDRITTSDDIKSYICNNCGGNEMEEGPAGVRCSDDECEAFYPFDQAGVPFDEWGPLKTEHGKSQDVLLDEVINEYEDLLEDHSDEISALKHDNQSLRKEVEKVKKELAQVIAERCLDNLNSSHPSISSLVGSPYKSDRSLRRHTKDVIDFIINKVGEEEYVKQVMLASRVAKRLSVTLAAEQQATSVEQKTVAAVIASIQAWYAKLYERHRGRFTNNSHTAFESVNQAVSMEIVGFKTSLAARAALLGQRTNH